VAACKRDETRRWIEREIEDGSHLTIIIGLSTFSDARYTAGQIVESKAQGRVGVGEGEGSVNSSVDVGRSSAAGAAQSFHAPGEQIWAVWYQQVRFHWFKKKTVDTMSLVQGPSWEVIGDTRGKEGEQDWVVEAALGEEGEEGEKGETEMNMETLLQG